MVGVRYHQNQSGFTVLEIMIILMLISLLAILAFPAYARSRRVAARATCLANLRQLEGAKNQWSLENKVSNSAIPTDTDLFGENKYIRTKPVCPAGGSYSFGSLNQKVTCSLEEAEDHLVE
jgi:Tfp pilus assembly protein PilE